LFPKITDFGIENGQFYRKRAGQTSGSKPKPSGSGVQERAVRSSHAGVDVLANDQGTGRRIVRPISRTYGQGEQGPQLLQPSPAAKYVIQIPPQQRPAQGLSEAVRSNVHVSQPCQPEPIDGRATNNRTSRAGTLRPPIPPKVPLAASLCILCDFQQAIVESGAGAGAFCGECWTAAHRAAGSTPPANNVETDAPKVGNCASNGDNKDSNSPLDQITAENTKCNRHVHFQVPQPSRATRDGKVDENVKDPSNRVGSNEHLPPGKPSQASVKQAQPSQDPKANVQAQTMSIQEGRRKALSSQDRATTEKAKNGLASVDLRLNIARKEPSLDLGVNNSKNDSSVNDWNSAVVKGEEPRNTLRTESREQKNKATHDRRSAAKNRYLYDNSKDATKGNLSVEGATSAIDVAKGAFERNSASSELTSSESRPENSTMKDPFVIEPISTSKNSDPTSHAAERTGNNTALDALVDSTSLRVRTCEAGFSALCEFCSNLPATLTTDVGLFCDRCWDTAMQPEADRGVLTKPADVGDFPSARGPATQERVREDRRVRLVIDEARLEQSHHTSVDAAVEQRMCRCRGRPATVEVTDVGTLCQNCLGHVAKVGKAAGNLDESLFPAEGSATQEHVQSGQRLGSAELSESRAHETPTEIAAQHQPCKCASRQATFLVDDVGSLCRKCLGLVLETDEISGNLSTSVSDPSKESIGTKKPWSPSCVESEVTNRPRDSRTVFTVESTKKTEPVAQVRAHGQQELLDNESPRRESNGLPVLYVCKSCGKHPATDLQEIRWVCLGCLGRETGDSTGHSSKSTA